MSKTFKNKTEIINEINTFINTAKSYKPLLRNRYYSMYPFYEYCKNNNLTLLDEKFFTNKISEKLRNRSNNIAIVCDSNNTKKIFTIRNKGIVKEMNSTLSYDTLMEIYNAFVSEVESYPKFLRHIKLIEEASDILKNKEIIILYKVDEINTFYIEKITNIKFNKNEICLTFSTQTYAFNINNLKCITTDCRKYTTSIPTIPKILKKLKLINNSIVIDKNDLINKLNKLKEDAHNEIEKNFINLNSITDSL